MSNLSAEYLVVFLGLVTSSMTAATQQKPAPQPKPFTIERCDLDRAKWTTEMSTDSLHRLTHEELFTRQQELDVCRTSVIPTPSAFPRKGESAADSSTRYGLELEAWSESMKLSWLYAGEVAFRATLYINTHGLADNYETFENGLIANGRQTNEGNKHDA